jgi:hypothetical protein
MIPLGGRNSGAVIRKRSVGTTISSMNYADSPKEVGLHSFLRRTMNFIMTLLS